MLPAMVDASPQLSLSISSSLFLSFDSYLSRTDTKRADGGGVSYRVRTYTLAQPVGGHVESLVCDGVFFRRCGAERTVAPGGANTLRTERRRRIEDPAATYLPGLATGTGGVGGAGGGGTRDNGGTGGPGCTGGPGGTGPTDSEEKTNFLDNTLCAAQYVRKHVARAHSLSGSAADSL